MVRVRQALYRLRGWLRSWIYEWPVSMRVVTHDGQRDINRVVRHEVTGGHLLIEDMDGCLFLWQLCEVRRYGPTASLEPRIHVLPSKPIQVEGLL